MQGQYDKLLPEVIKIAKSAGEQISCIYLKHKDFAVEVKEDNSPVTKADHASHKLIENALNCLSRQYPILSEEGEKIEFSTRKEWSTYWLIDPLDGTKEFIHRSDEFTVNIALIDNHIPVLGVVAVPIFDEIYWAIKGSGAFWQKEGQEAQKINVRKKSDTLRITVSRLHKNIKKIDEFVSKLKIPYEIVPCGSTLKILLVARGLADIYPRFGWTKEWDTAAGQVILEEAGGSVFDLSGRPLTYNARESLTNPEFVAFGDLDFTVDIVDNL